jgi:hypothetical protein
MTGIVEDIRYAARTLARNPGFVVVTVLTLALGIGANAAIFSVVDAVMLAPLPYPDAERIVRVSGPGLQSFVRSSRRFDSQCGRRGDVGARPARDPGRSTPGASC